MVRSAQSGRASCAMPLGAGMQARYGAPYWMVHRADLQACLLEAARRQPDISITLGARVEDYAIHRNGLTIQSRRGTQFVEDHAIALIGADGLWSRLRERVGNHMQPQFRQRTAWRSLVPAVGLAERYREPVVQLWLGSDGHLVHYPVQGGEAVNVVAIARDFRENPGWSGEGSREDLLSRFSRLALVAAGAGTVEDSGKLAGLEPLRSAAAAALGRRTGDVGRRCRASDAAVPGAGRRHGDRGRGRARPSLGAVTRRRAAAFRAYEAAPAQPRRAGAAGRKREMARSTTWPVRKGSSAISACGWSAGAA